MAKQLAQLLEPHRPLFIEEPLLPGHVNELKDLYNKTSIPIAVSPRLLSLIISETPADFNACSLEKDCLRVSTADLTLRLGVLISFSQTLPMQEVSARPKRSPPWPSKSHRPDYITCPGL